MELRNGIFFTQRKFGTTTSVETVGGVYLKGGNDVSLWHGVRRNISVLYKKSAFKTTWRPGGCGGGAIVKRAGMEKQRASVCARGFIENGFLNINGPGKSQEFFRCILGRADH